MLLIRAVCKVMMRVVCKVMNVISLAVFRQDLHYVFPVWTSTKWHRAKPNFQVGDLELMTDGNVFTAQWTTGRVVATYAGKDNLVRVVDVQTQTVINPTKSTTNKTLLASQLKTKTAIY